MKEFDTYNPLTAIRSAIVNKNREQLMTKAIRNFTIPYGQLIEVRVNTEEGKILLEIKLKGEIEITQIAVYGISLSREKSYFSIRFKKIKTSKPWLNTLLENYQQYIFPDNEIRTPRNFMMDYYFFFL
ncbi:MAG TPA: hypothetical protein DCQ31_18820 [Bacteroidales bacterium]|nr:hypothetical protein [Bacteroidales bacterium]